MENSGGWESLDKVDLSIGGTKDNIRAIRLHATATGEFSKTELTGDAELTLTRDWREKVQKAKKDVQPEPQPEPQPDPQQDPQHDPQPGDEEW